jgi:hypothetical protein
MRFICVSLELGLASQDLPIHKQMRLFDFVKKILLKTMLGLVRTMPSSVVNSLAPIVSATDVDDAPNGV